MLPSQEELCSTALLMRKYEKIL